MGSSIFSVVLLAGAATVVQASLYPGKSNLNHTCALQPSYLSCTPQASPLTTDSCCTETYGGLVLATQFWDTYTGLEKQGQVLPRNTWSLHGLWPDFCNGSYTGYCDLSRQYDPLPSPNTTTAYLTGPPIKVPAYTGPNIGTFLSAFGAYDLLAFMNKFWIAQNQPNADFWGHEFSKHATCFSSFDVECYGPDYKPHEEILDFFSTTVSYYQNLPTYGWLSAASIRPSNSTSFSLSSIQSALTTGFGALPYIGCSGPRYNATDAGKGSLDNGYTVLSEVWYYYHVYGRVQRNQGLPVNASINGGSVSSCAKTAGAIKYPTRTVGSEGPDFAGFQY